MLHDRYFCRNASLQQEVHVLQEERKTLERRLEAILKELDDTRRVLQVSRRVREVDATYTSELETVIGRAAGGRFFARLAPPAMGRRVFDALTAYANGLRTVLTDMPVPATRNI